MTIDRGWIRTVCLAGVLLSVTGDGVAQERSKAYLEVVQGAITEFESGNYAEARVLFEQAHGMRPSARTLRGIGLASFELKEYVRAEQELGGALVDLRQPLSEPQRKEVLGLMLRLERYIGRLEVHPKPEHATVRIDGRAIRGAIKIELGKHELRVEAPGHREVVQTVNVQGGKSQVLHIALTPISAGARPMAAPEASLRGAPAPRSHTDEGGVFEQWWFWGAVGLVAVGGAVTAVALSARSRVEAPVPGDTGAIVQVLSVSH